MSKKKEKKRSPYRHTYINIWASLVAQSVKNPPAVQETWV